MDITLLSAGRQAELIATEQLSAVELLDATVERYQSVNPVVNAVVIERLDQAHRQAQAADTAVAEGHELGPFHGVPVTIKEVMDWVGTPSTWGNRRHVDHMPDRNAEVVDRLLGAGAIIWGKTNVPRNLGQWQTFNTIYGTTNNPYDITRTCGGSSGGSAVALATGMASLEVGSDIGGSIRFPAHFCGVFGHKPSFGAVSAAGHTFPGQDAEVDINVVGPMARTAIDLHRAMCLFSDRILPCEERDRLDQFRVGVLLENPVGGDQDQEMTGLIGAAIERLVDSGLQVSTAPQLVDHRLAQRNYLLMNFAATSMMDEPATEPGRVAASGSMSHRMWIELANERERIRRDWERYFEQVDVLVCPVSASAAPLHQTEVPFPDQTITVNGQQVSIRDQWVWAGIASGAYLPATAVPVAQTRMGLPVGVQLLAPFGHDLRSIRLAALIERELGGFVPPAIVAD